MYRRKDAYYARAKAAGYRARSAYKLLELAQRDRLLRPGNTVVDLGAWPGGWLQVAGELVGPTGRVVGVDLQAIAPLPLPQIVYITGDVRAPAVQERLREACAGPVDVVLSDMAPKLTGVRVRDAADAQALAETVLELSQRLLRPGGRLLIKLFTSPELPDIVAHLRRLFRTVSMTRPDATRKGSAEMYAIAGGFRGQQAGDI